MVLAIIAGARLCSHDADQILVDGVRGRVYLYPPGEPPYGLCLRCFTALQRARAGLLDGSLSGDEAQALLAVTDLTDTEQAAFIRELSAASGTAAAQAGSHATRSKPWRTAKRGSGRVGGS